MIDLKGRNGKNRSDFRLFLFILVTRKNSRHNQYFTGIRFVYFLSMLEKLILPTHNRLVMGSKSCWAPL